MISRHSGRSPGILWIVGVAAFALILVFLASRGSGGVEQRRAAYRQAGIPTSEEELERTVSPMPDAESDALKLRTAMRGWKGFYSGPLTFHAFDWLNTTPALVTNFQKELIANHTSLELLHSVTNPGQSRIERKLNLQTDAEDQFYQFQRAVQESSAYLRLECHVHRLGGDPEKATQALVSGLRVVRTLEHTRPMSGHWDHQTLLDGWLHELEWLLSGGPLPAASLDLLQRELELHDERLGLTLVVQAIRASAFDSFRKQWVDSTGANPGIGNQPGAMERVLIKLYVGSGILSRDLLRALDFMDQFSGLAEKPTEAFQADEPRVIHAVGASGVLRSVVGHREIVTGEMLHQLWNRRLELVARLRCARAAVAVERWRVLHEGAIPKGLELLVPGVVPSLPLQPSGASPLLFSIRPSGYSIETPYGDSTRTPIVVSVQIPSPRPDAAARQ